MNTELGLDFILIYFVYGLAFFCLGLATLLESGRSPSLAEARVLRPLAVFGLIHGLHEWLEMMLLMQESLGQRFSIGIDYLRLGMLAVSFLSLIAYGVQVFKPPSGWVAQDAYISGGMMLIYLTSLFLVGAIPQHDPEGWAVLADLMARYLLAVPGALFAMMALSHQSNEAKKQQRLKLAGTLRWAGVGFGIYGLTQLIGPPAQLLLSNYVNTNIFLDVVGFPVQLIRAMIAVLIMVSLIRATQVVERERQLKLFQAQQDRLDALEQVQEEMRKRNQMRKDLLRRTVILQEEERTRISRELHDETAQSLTAFSANLKALNNQLPPKLKDIDIFTRLTSLTNQMSHSIRNLVHDLRPAQLDELGLAATLRFLAERMETDLDLHVSLTLEGTCERMDALVETVLFRVAQESLTNVAKHAKTKEADIQLHANGREIVLLIKDEGVGFNPDDVNHGAGLGIVGMRERVDAAGGQLEMETSPGTGTLVKATIPLDETCGERESG